MKHYKKERFIFSFILLFFILVLILILMPVLTSLLAPEINVDLIKAYNEAHTETDPNGLLPSGSEIISIRGTPDIQINPDNPAVASYLEISSTGEGGIEISTAKKTYSFLIASTNSLIINAVSSEIKEGSFSILPFKKTSEFIFENGIVKSKEGVKIEYAKSNSELKIKFLELPILKQDNLKNFNVEVSFAQLPIGGIYPINAKLKTREVSNLEYLGSSYEIPSDAEVNIVYGKLILPEGAKVKSFSALKEDFFKSISEKLGFNFDKNKMISFEGKNIDLGNGLIAEIPEGASISFDNSGNFLIGHTVGKEVKFNNGIDVRVSGIKSKTEGVYIFKSLAEAKSSEHENYIIFGQDFDARLGDTSKSGGVEVLFNRENPYVPVGENTHFSILGGNRANELSSEIKIRKFNPNLNELAVVDNKGFTVLNDNTRADFIFDAVGEEKGKAVGLSVGNYLNKEQVPMLARNHLDKKSDGKEIQIASLYSDVKEKVYFTSNIKTAEGLVVDSNLLSYKENFKPTTAKQIPFMEDVFEKDVQITMNTVAMINDENFIDMFQVYKPNYKGLKVSQNNYDDAYFDEYLKLAKGDRNKAQQIYNQVKQIVNAENDFAIRNKKLADLYKQKFGIDYFPTLDNPDPVFVNQAAAIAEFYYEAENRKYLPPESSQFSLDASEKIEVEALVKKGYSVRDAIKKVIKIGPNTMFSDPYIPAQNWWSMFGK